MLFANYATLFLTVMALVPGFIVNAGYSYFLNVREGQAQLFLIRYIVFSCLNYALIWPFVYKFIANQYWILHPYRWSFIIIMIVLIVPYLIGMVYGFLVSRDWIRMILRDKFNINPMHPTSTAWELVTLKNNYMIVTLKNGAKIYGLYSSSSLASSIHSEKDIYIEKLYNLDSESNWIEVTRTTGAWINASEILYIELLNT